MVHEYSEGVRDCPEHDTPHLPPLGQPMICSKGEKVSRNFFWHSERGHTRRL